MKCRITIQLALSLLLLTVTSSFAAETLLKPAELNNLFSDSTFTVTNARSHSKNYKKQFRTFTAKSGLARVELEDGASQSRTWSVNEDGQLCFSRSLNRKDGGATCGFVVTEDRTTFRFYKSKKIKQRSAGTVSGIKRRDLVLTFTGFVRGDKL